MTKTRQISMAARVKALTERRFIRSMGEWINELVSAYRIGAAVPSSDARDVLYNILRKEHLRASDAVLGFDVRAYKVDDDLYSEVARGISLVIIDEVIQRAQQSTDEITRTATKWIQRVSELAAQESWTPLQADVALTNYLKSQRVVVAMTESQWIVEASRRVSVRAVTDPLKNSVEQLANIFAAGDFNEGRKQARRIEKLLGLPLSEPQGKLIGYVSDIARPGIVRPESQARTVARLMEGAEAAGEEYKAWVPVGDNSTRETHLQAGAQYIENPIPIDQPFTVGGALMQHPGDGSLGAPLSEIINCRCAVSYVGRPENG